MDRRILVVAETREGRATPLTRELIGLARGLSADVSAVTFTRGIAPDLAASGAQRIHVIDAGADEYEGEVWVANIAHLAREIEPLAIFAGHTPAGADLAPRLAVRLEGGTAMGCVDVSGDGKLLFTRACHGGNVRETLSFSDIAVATIKAGVGAERQDPAANAEIVDVVPQAVSPRFRVVARERDTGSAKRLEDAKIVVAGGRGLEGAEGFRVLERLAETLDGVVGASRVPCDLGWCPHSWQIGLTGRTVTPDLYFAIGISGAGHHLAGCGSAKTIVAINTDPEAAIFREARFGVVGDYREIVPALTQALAELKPTGN